MQHTFTLAQPAREVSPIRIIVTHNHRIYRKTTGLSIRTTLWNGAAKKPQSKCRDAAVWQKLSPIHSRLVEREQDARTEEDVLAAMDYAITGNETPIPSDRPFLWDYFEDWSFRGSGRAKDRNLAYRRMVALMGRNTDWEDINGDWYFRFNQKCNELGYSHNYKSTMTAKLKTVMNEGFNRGFHANEEFRKFCTSYKPADAIALTQEEVDALWKARLSGRLAEARDVFIVGVYCAGRFQDYSKISSENVVDGKLRYVQRKTGETVILPCAPRIAKVLERHGGRLPKITEQEVGRHIKAIARNIGGSFLDIVEISKIQGDRKFIEKHARWELISTHTARRTGATLLYKSGLPVRICRFLTGHTTDAMFLNYLKIGKEEGAELLAQSSFFK